jgi:hypothetical protein
MHHSTAVSSVVSVARNSKRMAIKVHIPKRFSGNKNAAAALRDASIRELDGLLDRAMEVYVDATVTVTSRFESISIGDLAKAKVSHGERSNPEDGDEVAFFMPITTRLRKGGNLKQAIVSVKLRIKMRVLAYWTAYIQKLPA